ncbi:agmatine deiminase [Methylogaea oryzae]|uniref:Agmatine deiminase n=2 Tax=Methylogaea oryzae TaxID=1295382 RepID=A0A8D4VLW6_9GAMM|nr:agmatine deiminase [Methylogaea oryzae]
MAWPEPGGDFGPWLPQVERNYCDAAREISRRQGLIIACRDSGHRKHIEGLLSGAADMARVIFVEFPYNDCWVRDTAPITVLSDGQPLLLDFQFNGWGGKHDCALDAQLAQNLIATGIFDGAAQEKVPMVLEGGSIEVDGRGTLLTSKRCLLNVNRNPSMTRDDIEAALTQRFGLSRVLWLDFGHVEGDDTDSHIDTLARFCSPDTIAYTACDDPEDSHYIECGLMRDQLTEFATADGKPYTLVPLPMPKAIHDEDGLRLPAGYANFLIINGAVLVPVYDDPADAVALQRLAGCFPDRDIVPIDCRPLIHQYGSLHCATMQFPQALSIAALRKP